MSDYNSLTPEVGCQVQYIVRPLFIDQGGGGWGNLGMINSNALEEGMPVATYSMIGVDREAGLIGVAIQSHYLAVGSMAVWAEPGVGAVVIQSIPKMAYDYGVAGLNLMREGKTAEATLRRLIGHDAGRAFRQVAIADIYHPPVVYTGRSCVPEAGDVAAESFCCQANMMARKGVPRSMGEAFMASNGALEMRLLEGLNAAEARGGDIRGKQSAALVIVRMEPEGHHVLDRPFDLRVEDHPEPLEELSRLVRMKSAYLHSTKGDAALVREDFDEALEAYRKAEAAYPGQLELHFWRALALINKGRDVDAVPLLKELIQSDYKWLTLFERVSETELVEKDCGLMNKVRAVASEVRGADH